MKNFVSFFAGLSSGLISNTLGELLSCDLIFIWNLASKAYLCSLISIVLGSRLPVEADPYSRVWAIASRLSMSPYKVTKLITDPNVTNFNMEE
jgi:hypothetical protein